MEIEFRGKTIKNKWVYGFVSVVKSKTVGVPIGTYISNKVGLPFAYEVLDKTIGQYTGLKDTEGIKIYNGDIIRVFNHPFDGVLKFNGEYVVSWSEEDLCWVAGSLLLSKLKPYIKVVSNIHDKL